MKDRGWQQFHTPENLAKSVNIEAGELLECFQWNPDADLDEVADELADVLTYPRSFTGQVRHRHALADTTR